MLDVIAAKLQWHLPGVNLIDVYNRKFCPIDSISNAGINEQSFSNPHPCPCHIEA